MINNCLNVTVRKVEGTNSQYGLVLVNETGYESIDGRVYLREIQTDNCGVKMICGIGLVRFNKQFGLVCLDNKNILKEYQAYTKVWVVSKAICRSVHMESEVMHDTVDRKYERLFKEFPSVFLSSTKHTNDLISSKIFDDVILSHLFEANALESSSKVCKQPLLVKCNSKNTTYFPPLKIVKMHVIFILYRPGKDNYHLCGPLHLINEANLQWNNSKTSISSQTVDNCADECLNSRDCVAFGFFPLKSGSICHLTNKQCENVQSNKMVYLRPGQNLYVRTSQRCSNRLYANEMYFENYFKPSYCYTILKDKFNWEEAEKECSNRGMAILKVTENNEYLPNMVKTFFSTKGERIWLPIIKKDGGFYWRNVFQSRDKLLKVKSKFYPLKSLREDCNSALIRYNKNYLLMDREKINCKSRLTTICYKPKDGWNITESQKWLIKEMLKKPNPPYIGDNDKAIHFKYHYCNLKFNHVDQSYCFPQFKSLARYTDIVNFGSSKINYSSRTSSIKDLESFDGFLIMRTFTNHDCDHIKATVNIFGFIDQIEINSGNSRCGFLYMRWNGLLKPLCININNIKALAQERRKYLMKGLCATFGLDYLWLNADLQPTITFKDDHLGLEINHSIIDLYENIYPRHILEIPFLKIKSDSSCTQPPLTLKLWCRIFDRLPRPDMVLQSLPSIKYSFKFFRPALWDICGPTHLFRFHFGSFTKRNSSSVSTERIIPYENGNDPTARKYIVGKTFFECRKICSDSQTYVGFLYIPMKDDKLIGYCGLTERYCDTDPNYAYTYIPAGHWLYVKTHDICSKFSTVPIDNVLYDALTKVCFVIKRNVTYREATKYCQSIEMNMFRPDLLSESVKTLFPSKETVWMSTKLIDYRLHYNSNFGDGKRYELLDNNQLKGLNISDIPLSNCIALYVSYRTVDLKDMFGLNRRRLPLKNEILCNFSKLTAICQRPLRGGWSPWTKWSDCPCYFKSVTNIKQYRTRKCNDPGPAEEFLESPCGTQSLEERQVRRCWQFTSPNSVHMAVEIEFYGHLRTKDICQSMIATQRDDSEVSLNKFLSIPTIQHSVENMISFELCINWCLQDKLCREVYSLKIEDKRYKCVKSTSFCSFLKSKSSSLERLYRLTDKRCIFTSNVCQLPIFYYDELSGYCLSYGGYLTYEEGVQYCQNLGLHLFKLSNVQKASNLVRFLRNAFKNMTLWLGIRKMKGPERTFVWDSFVWNDTDVVDEKVVSSLEGDCYLAMIEEKEIQWQGADCEEKHQTLCWRPLIGEWSSWSNWNFDSNIKGKSFRTRKCNNPKPSKPHYNCFGDDFEYRNRRKEMKISLLGQLTIFGWFRIRKQM
ncbi:DgyrCDS9002 [Dimorphilus gyrociliatus]|uniref:DgyrCDS9002 n=1 Tax=Dimorphilus gyrociliatus TaxID=2664684 RepID=A0A7I8VW28_9ANNE|nr:DgyrCDS9002 [Dimorphilus gyrociliatus]